MISRLLFTVWLCCFASAALADGILSLLTDNRLQLCGQNNVPPPAFDKSACRAADGIRPDPDNTSLWLRFTFDNAELQSTISPPYALFILARASSAVYLNNIKLGENGMPSATAAQEVAGNIDHHFFLPQALLRESGNELIVLLSAHRNVLDLEAPVHFIGIAHYQSPVQLIQQYHALALVLLGCLLIGALYFLVLSLHPQHRNNLLLFIMTLLATCQLLAELLRALYSYPYYWHDYRLLLITSLSFLFGCCLVYFITAKFVPNQKMYWVVANAALALIAIGLVPGFDPKTSIALFVPGKLICLLLIYHYVKTHSAPTLRYLVVFLCFTLLIVISRSHFHETLFYLLITLMLCYLFVQQAREFNNERELRLQQQKRSAKLELKLAEYAQHNEPKMLNINSAGKVERVSTADIAYCRASGDYVDLYLLTDKHMLYSGNLKELEAILPDTFLRVHRSYLVNLQYVQMLCSNAGAGGYLLLVNGMQVPVSRRVLPAVRQAVAI